MTQPDIRGLIFDLDGVIADTAEFHYRAWQRLADEEGVRFSRETYLRMTGTSRNENLQVFTENLQLDEATKREWMQRKDGYFVEMRDTLKPGDALPGVENLLKEAQVAGLKIGLASASRHAKDILRLLGLSDYFQVLGDGTIISNSKPAPDVFLWVAGGLGLAPRNCLVLEDAPAGVEAALRGGFYVLGLGSNPLEKAHIRLPHLGETNLRQILNFLKEE
jgi:beta-phosphoglucomutase